MYKIKPIIIFFFLLFGLYNSINANEPFKIQNITILNNKDLSQVKNGNLHLKWEYSRHLKNAKLTFIISKQKVDEDSIVWLSNEQYLDKPEYVITCPWLLEKGKTYILSIKGKDLNNGVIEKSQIVFTINSPPEKVDVFTNNNMIFRKEKIIFRISESTDNQIDSKKIKYQINIFSESDKIKPIVDTLIRITEKDSEKLLVIDNNLQENNKFFVYFRAWDGVDYSEKSSQIQFFINKNDEPPESFDLIGDSDLIVSEYPLLKWNKTYDPENKIGGKIINYTVVISPDEEFYEILSRVVIDPELTCYKAIELENHRKYFWKVIAMDSDSLITSSSRTNSITANYGNEPPPKPQVNNPVSGQIIKPNDYLIWKQPDDPDKWDKLSYSVYILNDTKDTLLKEEISDSLIQLAKYNIVNGLSVYYDNRIKFQMNNFDLNSKLSDAKKYNFQVTSYDNWGGKVNSDWINSDFIFDDNINSNPNPPTKNFYPDSAIIYTTFPILKWDAGTDSDVEDELKYEIMLSRDADFNDTRFVSLLTSYNECEYEIKSSLVENEKYYWKVRSIDLEERKSKWSISNVFWINSINERPIGPVELLSPETLTEFNNNSSFWWFSTFDPDPGDRKEYILELASDKFFKNIVYSYNVKSSSLSAEWKGNPPPGAIGIHISECSDYSRLVDNRMYYWKVVAKDQRGFCSVSPQKPPRIFFNNKNDPPSIPDGIKPGNGIIVTNKKMKISWQPSMDPDFSDFSTTLRYQIIFSQNPDFPDKESLQYTTKVGNNFIEISDKLVENKKYYYKIKSIDKHNLSSSWSVPDSFIVNFIKEPPLMVSESIVPRDSMIVKSVNPVISWQKTTDPDPEQIYGIKYHIRYVPVKYIGTRKEKNYSKEVITENDVNYIQLNSLIENEYYSFKIAAKDKEGVLSKWSNSHVFAVNVSDSPPSGFNLIYPDYNADSISIDSKLIWSNSYDSDPGDEVYYTLYYSEDSLMLNNVKEINIYESYFDSVYYQPLPLLKSATKYFWKVVAEDKSGNQVWGSNSNNNIFKFHTIGYKRRQLSIPQKFVLYDNHPNPFMTSTKIQYEVSEYSNVKISIYNILGEEISRLVDDQHLAGKYTIIWNGTDSNGRMVPGGMYLCRMTAKEFITHKKIVLLR